MHTGGGPAVFSRALLNAWGRVLAEAGADPDNEVLIIAGTGRRWIAGIDPKSFADPVSQWPSDVLYEHYSDGVRLLEGLVLGVDVPTIGVLNGRDAWQSEGCRAPTTSPATPTAIAESALAAAAPDATAAPELPGAPTYTALEP
ncbi:hypothetical protein NRF20_36485 [Streptomyces sp. R-74717]|uniref:hypothetical protein n=1 Tax=Streptomyces sp. R-74717 TaxID=2969820 RepID=UPI0039B5BDD2